MEIVLQNTKGKYLEIFSLLDLDSIHETIKKFSSIKGPLKAKIFAVNESISSNQLLKLKRDPLKDQWQSYEQRQLNLISPEMFQILLQ